MNRIKQEIPVEVEVGQPGLWPKEAEFASLEELLEIPWVKLATMRPGFHRFSLWGTRLMAEFQQGRFWYVVGHLDQPVDGLPVRN